MSIVEVAAWLIVLSFVIPLVIGVFGMVLDWFEEMGDFGYDAKRMREYRKKLDSNPAALTPYKPPKKPGHEDLAVPPSYPETPSAPSPE